MTACPVSASLYAHERRLTREADEELAFEAWQEAQPNKARLEDLEQWMDDTGRREAFDAWQMDQWRKQRVAA